LEKKGDGSTPGKYYPDMSGAVPHCPAIPVPELNILAFLVRDTGFARFCIEKCLDRLRAKTSWGVLSDPKSAGEDT